MNNDKSGILNWLSRRLNLTELFSLLTGFGLFYGELDNRKPLQEALDEALKEPTPSYSRWPQVLGLIVVVLLGVVLVSGALLTLYYLPTPQTAHASVRTILRDVNFGWFVHHVHFWGAQFLIAVLVVRTIRLFVHRAYRPPRELIWVFATLLLLVALHSDLTGRFLPWTTDSYWASARALDIVKAVPVYGSFVSFLIGGGESYTSELTLIRFYVLHVAILPVLALMLVYLHFSSVRRLGLSESRGQNAIAGRKFLRTHIANLGILITLVFGFLITVAVLAPVAFHARADPYSTVPGIGPPWYLLAPFGLLELTRGVLPQWLPGTALFLAYVVFIMVPFLDRSGPGRLGQAVSFALAMLTAIAWIALTIYGAMVV